MNKTITMYELLGLVKDDKAPKKVRYKNKIYEWKEYNVCYGKIMTKKGWVKELGYVAEENNTYFYLKHCYQDLNDEVEILEEEKKIPEKIEYYDDSIAWAIDDVGQLSDVDKVIIDKLNDVIDYLKSKGDE